MLNDLIKNHLSVLNDLPIRCVGRAGNMAWIGFGPDVVSKDYKNNERITTKYSLHVQGGLRIIDSTGILFGSYDMYEPNSNTEWSETFDWDVQGVNYFDEHAAKLTAEFKNNNITVTKIVGTVYGDLTIVLSNDIVIEIFINSGTNLECWRFFEVGNENPHFIVTGQGIEL